ncbi:uncharacterized protein LOC135387374 [Ornithodoros turicata]|uniref:uncharacterized protein LOC135387374 n=1 Tax=Ornithodoros turicata TaxID=34597 RepID=UPI003138F871
MEGRYSPPAVPRVKMALWVRHIGGLFWSFLTWIFPNLFAYQELKEEMYEMGPGVEIPEEMLPQNLPGPYDETPPPSPLLAYPKSNAPPPSPTLQKSSECNIEPSNDGRKDTELLEPSSGDSEEPDRRDQLSDSSTCTLPVSVSDAEAARGDAVAPHGVAKRKPQGIVSAPVHRGCGTNKLRHIGCQSPKGVLAARPPFQPNLSPRSVSRSGRLQSCERLTPSPTPSATLQHRAAGVIRRRLEGSGEPVAMVKQQTPQRWK